MAQRWFYFFVGPASDAIWNDCDLLPIDRWPSFWEKLLAQSENPKVRPTGKQQEMLSK